MYNYEKERSFVLTDEGQRKFLKVRDRVKNLLKLAGCVRTQEAIAECTGSSWESLACVDRLVELKELIEIPQSDVAGQHRIFVAPYE